MKINCIIKLHKIENVPYSGIVKFVENIKEYDEKEVNRLKYVKQRCIEILPRLIAEENKDESLIKFTKDKIVKIDNLLSIYNVFFVYNKYVNDILYYYCSEVLDKKFFQSVYDEALDRMKKYIEITKESSSLDIKGCSSLEECMSYVNDNRYKEALNLKLYRAYNFFHIHALNEKFELNEISEEDYNEQLNKLQTKNNELVTKLMEYKDNFNIEKNNSIVQWFMGVLYEKTTDVEISKLLSDCRRLLKAYISKRNDVIKRVLYKRIKLNMVSQSTIDFRKEMSNFIIELYGVYKSYADELGNNIDDINLSKEEIVLRYYELYNTTEENMPPTKVFEKLDTLIERNMALKKIDNEQYKLSHRTIKDLLKLRNNL